MNTVRLDMNVDGDRSMTTWRALDPRELILDYTFTLTLDDFEDWDEPVELVEEVWVLESRTVVRTVVPCSEPRCEAEATRWGLCEAHAREDDPDAFEDDQ